MGKVPKPRIVWKGAHPTNFTKGRPNGRRNGQLTKHHIVGSEDSAIAVFQNPSRNGSAHFVVGDRDITQMVSIDDTAWTDGVWASNLRTITIEHEGGWQYIGGKYGPYTEGMQNNAAALIAWLRDQGFVTHFKAHREINPGTVCFGDLPAQRIWNKATAIIAKYNKPTPPPAQAQWQKNFTTKNAPPYVYAQKDGVRIYNIADLGNNHDTRRWGINQRFDIGATTTIDGKTYYITKSSVDSGAASGLLKGEVDTTKYVAPPPPITLVKVDKITGKEFSVLGNTQLVKIPSGERSKQPGKIDFTSGEVIESIAELRHYSNGKKFYRTAYSISKNIEHGFVSSSLAEKTPPVVPDKPPVREMPDWVYDMQEEPSRPMYVLRSTPLIDLENGHPYLDPKTNKEVWFQAGDIVKDIVAQVDIFENTYRLTKFAFTKTKGGEYAMFANGIDSDDLSVDPKSVPEDTPGNPSTDDNINWIVKALKAILAFFKITV